MRRILLLFIFSFITSQLLNAQDSVFTLSGSVTDCQTHKRIKGVTLKLVCSDGRCYETLTNELGNYFFDCSIIKINRQYVLTTQTEMGLGYFNTSDRYKFDTYDSVTKWAIKNDFCLQKDNGCILRLPVLYFKKNSITEYTYAQERIDLEFLKEIMLDNPTFVIEIGAYNSFEEKSPSKLSLKRAKHLQKLLVEKGIEKTRLPIKVYKPDDVTYSKEEGGETNKKKSRIVFNIVAKDYVKSKTG